MTEGFDVLLTYVLGLFLKITKFCDPAIFVNRISQKKREKKELSLETTVMFIVLLRPENALDFYKFFQNY